MMEKLSKVYSLLVRKNQHILNNTIANSRALLALVCLPALFFSQTVYAEFSYRQVCGSPVMVCVGERGKEYCTATVSCHWEVVSTGQSGPPPSATPPLPNPNTGNGAVGGASPAQTSCDLKKAQSTNAKDECDKATAIFKSQQNMQCSSAPAVVSVPITAELAATLGMDAKLLNGSIVFNVGGTWIREFHPRESCLMGAADAVAIKEANCKAESSARDVARVNAGCPL